MKKLLCLLTICVFTLGAYSQDTKPEKMDKKMDGKMGKMEMKDCVMMKDGKMMVTKKGNTMAMDETMTMANGTMVMADGTVKMKDGKTKMLKNGDCVYMDGKMKMMKMHNKMHDKMKEKDPK